VLLGKEEAEEEHFRDLKKACGRRDIAFESESLVKFYIYNICIYITYLRVNVV